MKRVTVFLPEAEYEALRTRAFAERTSLSALLRGGTTSSGAATHVTISTAIDSRAVERLRPGEPASPVVPDAMTAAQEAAKGRRRER